MQPTPVGDATRAVRKARGDLKKVLKAAVVDPATQRVKLTRSGVQIFTAQGSAGTHFGGSDQANIRNFKADLRRIGIEV